MRDASCVLRGKRGNRQWSTVSGPWVSFVDGLLSIVFVLSRIPYLVSRPTLYPQCCVPPGGNKGLRQKMRE